METKKKYKVIDDPLSAEKPIQNITLQEFLDSGLLVPVNQFLHIFGFALHYECDSKGNPTEECLRPSRTIFRGFSEQSQDKSYKKITQYMRDHCEDLQKDINMDTKQ